MGQSKSVTARLSAKDNGFSRTMNGALSSLRKFSSGTSTLSSQATRVKSSFGTIIGALGIYKAASIAATSVTNSFAGAISRYDTMNNFPKVMKQLGYSAEESTKAVNDLSKGVQGLPTPLNEVVSTAQRLTVLTGNLGKSTKLTIALNDAFLASGSSSADASRGLQQFTQMLAVGKVDMMAWRTLQETMPIALTKTANAFGYAGQSAQTDFYNALQEGTITFDQFAEKLIELDGGASGFSAMARAATDGVAMAMSNAKTAVTRGVTRSIEAFDTFNKAVGGMTVAQMITAMGTTIENVLKTVSVRFENFATVAKPYVDKVKEAFSRIAPAVKNAVSSVVSSLTGSGKSFLEQSSTVNNFRMYIDKASDAVVKFSNYIQQNAGKVADYAKKVGALWLAFKGYTLISQATKGIITFSKSTTSVLSKVFDASLMMDAKWRQYVLTPLVTAIKSGSVTVQSQLMIFKETFKNGMNSLENKATYGNVTRGFVSIKQAVATTFPTFSKLAKVTLHPIRSLAQLSIASKGTGTAVNGASILIGNGFRRLATAGISSITRLNIAMASNPITAILLLITAGIASAISAWKSNFMNIQGYVKTSFGGIVNSLKNILPNFKSVTNGVKSFGNTFKWLGTGVIVGVTLAIAGFVDNLRLIITIGKSVVNAVMAIANGIKGLWKVLTGDAKGADKAFKEAKKSLSDIGKDWDTLFSDSALKKAGKSTEELGKQAKNTAKSISLHMASASTSVDAYSSKLEEAKQAMTDMFSQANGSTAGVEAYFKHTLDLVTSMKDQQKKAIETYNKQIESAEGKSEEKKRQIYANASSEFMKTVQNSNANLMKVYSDYSAQLKNNKTIEGQELNEQQRSTLQTQTNIIRDQLLQQNKQYVEASVNKIANKQQLSIQEQQQAQQSLQTLGEIETQQIEANNAQIKQLTEQKNQAKTASEQAAFQNQLMQLQTQNAQIRQNELEQGAQLFAIISQNGKNTIAVTSSNLAQLKNVTDQQLLGVYQSYVNTGANTNEQMALLAGMLRQRGIDGANGFVQGLQSNDPSKWASMSRADIVNTLQALPPDLFRNGQEGKNQLINGLQSGKTTITAVGKELIASMNSGQNSQKPNSKRAGADNSSAAAEGTRSKGNEHKNAGKSNAQQSNAGTTSEKTNAKNAGTQLGVATVQGVQSQTNNATAAGRELGNAIKSGAGSVDTTSIGSNLAKGVASGIRSSQGEAVAAMRQLVAAVDKAGQRKGEIKSPSRLLKRHVGVFLAQGVAAGIKEDTSVAVQRAKEMITTIQQAITGSRLVKRSNAIEVKHSIDNTPIDRLFEMLQEIKNLTVVMDTGRVIGALGTPMNHNLAEQQKQDGRYRS